MQAQCLGSARRYCPTLGVPWVSRGCAFTWYLEVDLSKWTSCADFEQNDAISLSVKLYWRRLIYSLKLCVYQTRARVIGIYYCDLIMQASCYIWVQRGKWHVSSNASSYLYLCTTWTYETLKHLSNVETACKATTSQYNNSWDSSRPMG